MMIALNILWKHKKWVLIALGLAVASFLVWNYTKAVERARTLSADNLRLNNELKLQVESERKANEIEKEIRALNDDDFIKRRDVWLRD
jgi:hypothetical protein